MNPNNRAVTLTVILASMLVAVLIYVGLTYVIQIPERPVNTALVRGLAAIAAVSFLGGFLLEQQLVTRAKSAAGVQTAAIVSAALGESIAVLGLVVYFISGKREWVFFAAGLVYILALMIRIPRFLEAMNGKDGDR